LAKGADTINSNTAVGCVEQSHEVGDRLARAELGECLRREAAVIPG
jgi:hypothetical protein